LQTSIDTRLQSHFFSRAKAGAQDNDSKGLKTTGETGEDRHWLILALPLPH
jgi:hypothetical protein